MYSCPLCCLKKNFPQDSFYSIQSLKNHIDSDHCLITKPKIDNNLLLEREIQDSINVGLAKLELFRKNFKDQNFDLNSKVDRSRIELDDQFEKLTLENEYLKNQLKHKKIDSENFRRRFEEKNEKFKKLIIFVEKSALEQKMGKMEMRKFLDDLLDDIDKKELEIDQMKSILNQWSKIKTMQKTEDDNDQPIGSPRKMIRIKSSIADSGYEGSDVDCTRPRPMARKKKFRHSKDFTTVIDVQDQQTLNRVLQHLEPYLDTVDLQKCKLVCRTWRKSIDNFNLRNRLLIDHKILSIDQLQKLFDTVQDLVSLELVNLKVKDSTEKGVLEPLLETLLQQSTNTLQFLKILECSPYLTDRLRNLPGHLFSMCSHVEINGLYITSSKIFRALWLASCLSPHLHHVIYSTIDDRFSMTLPVIWSLGAGCRQITSFVVTAAGSIHNKGPSSLLHFDDNCLLTVARCWSATLTRLCLDGRFISLGGLAIIGQRCFVLQNLEVDHLSIPLSLSDCMFLFGNGFQNLNIFTLMQCRISAQAVYYTCGALKNLRKLKIIWKIFETGDAQYDHAFLPDLQEIQELRENYNDIKNKVSLIVSTDFQ